MSDETIGIALGLSAVLGKMAMAWVKTRSEKSLKDAMSSAIDNGVDKRLVGEIAALKDEQAQANAELQAQNEELKEQNRELQRTIVRLDAKNARWNVALALIFFVLGIVTPLVLRHFGIG